jgi:hypothetical protein
MNILKLVPVVVMSAVASVTVAADATERKFLREGMHEGEVLLKIGKPDHETFVRNVKGHVEEKTWTYFPSHKDSQTITIISFRAGLVAAIERKIVR